MPVSLADGHSIWYICGMQDITASIATLYKQWKGEEAKSIELLPQSGSERRYFRIYYIRQLIKVWNYSCELIT